MKKLLIGGCLAFFPVVNVFAQSGTHSPYSQYGVGILSDISQGFNRGMNGVGQGLRRSNVVNAMNPASYSAVDSLTMIFDVGISGQKTNYKEGNTKVNGMDANFEYVVSSFRLMPKIGMAFGVLPFSNVGYNYAFSEKIETGATMTKTYTGEGGMRQAFLGAGWSVSPQLSVGMNVGYIWGTIDRSVLMSSTGAANTMSKKYSMTVNSYTINAGAQWNQLVSPVDLVTIGATVGVGHNLGATAKCEISNASGASPTTYEIGDALSLPMTYAVGAFWNHGRSLLLGADLSIQKWGGLDYPYHDTMSDKYELRNGLLKDRYQVNLGGDYVKDEMSRKFFDRMHYRFGAGYATPYYNINGDNGPKEISVSAGVGIPLKNAYNNRSVLNVSAQWIQTSAKDMITENTFRINVGITFNERWFAKWKIE